MIVIRDGGLGRPEVVALLAEHGRAMEANSPPGTCFYLGHAALAAPGIGFWSAWAGDRLAGVAALKAMEGAGEVKSMRVASACLGSGVGRALLDHLIAIARGRDYRALYLETGTGAYFAPAQALYERAGFVDCPAFADYAPSDHNRFMILELR